VRQSQAALAQGQAKQAFDMLAAQEVNRAGDPDFDMALGNAASAAKEYTRAIMAFERILAVQPENAEARGGLGRALFAVGDRKTARQLLSDSQLGGIPSVAGEPIDQLLQAIDRVEAEGHSSAKGYVEVTVGHDSNVNAGPAFRSVAVPAFGGAITPLVPSGIETSASFANLAAGGSGRYVLDPRWSLIGNVSANARWHGSSADMFDSSSLDGNGGVSYRVERQEYTLVLQLGQYDIDSQRIRNSRGLVGEWTYRFDGFRQFSAYFQYGRLSYPTATIADVDRTVVGMSYAQMSATGLFGYGGVYVGEEAERAPGFAYLGHRLYGIRAGVQYPMGPQVAAFATAAYENRRFGGVDPSFLVQRHDDQWNFSLGISWIPAPYWRVTPQVGWSKVDSTVPLADYDRRVVSVAVRRDF
jgi:outer membrane protein